ncbi:MAG: DegT/DnrJ/EryC1/StrS family aminotransferase [Candidatus Aenigmatarchaeota archaeon]
MKTGNWKIPLFKIYWDNDDIAAVSSAISKGMYWALGPEIEKFEKSIAKYIGVKHVVSFNSGTSALHAAMLAHGIGPGDEVIVPSFTFIATANAALFVNACPVFADIEEQSFGLDPVDVERKITPRTKAIIAVHYAGQPCMIKELRKIADKHNLILIEDAAEAFGAETGSCHVGSFGDSAVLSFCSNKIITTGEGGAVATNDKKLYKKLKLICSHGRKEKENYFSSSDSSDYIDLGYNFRMSNITAALGISQLNKASKFITMRRNNADYMNKNLSTIEKISIPKESVKNFNVYQMYTIRLQDEKTRNKLLEFLAKKGIMSKKYFSPVHLSEFYRKKFSYKEGLLPVTENVSRQVLTLPMYPHMTKEEMDMIIEGVKAFFSRV